MNYRHSYHAGGFSDVVKHVILTALLTSLLRKPNAICYLDTHAGGGYYDLMSEFASKGQEYVNGIEKIIRQERLPALVKQYLNCIHRINNTLTGSRYASLKYYPGSPMIARYLLRPYDRIVACELQPQEYQALRAAFPGDKQMSIHHMDGFLGLKAFLPPREKRGLVLIDPPYENPEEFNRIAHNLPTALKRWERGIYAIWYPIKEKSLVDRFYRTVSQNIHQPKLAIEFTIYPDLPNHLNGCGLIVINPPWKFDQNLQETLPWLWKALTINNQGGYRTFFLK